MADTQIAAEIESTISVPPTESIQHALGANHDIRTGLAEIIDNAIDASATQVQIVFQTEGHRIVQIAIHDDGVGMNESHLVDVLSLGGHTAHSEHNIGRYGIGMKEGSYANANTLTVVSRRFGDVPVGYQLSKKNFQAGRLNERSLTRIWNLRNDLTSLRHGTSIIWNDLTSVYEGVDEDEGYDFQSEIIEAIRKFVGIRYHRFLENKKLDISLYVRYDDELPAATPAPVAVNPIGHRKSGHKKYPRQLTIGGKAGELGVTAYIWPNKSKTEAFNLEAKDAMGHQGFYVYDADRLITSGGWAGFVNPKKDLKLLRIVIDDPPVLDEYITISPQKGDIRLAEGFHRFVEQLRAVDNPKVGFKEVCDDATETLRASNRRSGNPDPLAEAGRGLDPVIKATVSELAQLKHDEPIEVVWGPIESGDFVEIGYNSSSIIINQDYRKDLVGRRGGLNDLPLIKSLLYLLFNDAVTKKRTAKSEANVKLWIDILNAAVEKQVLLNRRS